MRRIWSIKQNGEQEKPVSPAQIRDYRICASRRIPERHLVVDRLGHRRALMQPLYRLIQSTDRHSLGVYPMRFKNIGYKPVFFDTFQ